MPYHPAPSDSAPLGRRVVALAIDWALALLIDRALTRLLGRGQFGPLVALLAMNVLLVGTSGFTPGHRVSGLRVVTPGGGLPGPVKALVRSVLLCLAVPPLVTGRDGRGLHDRLAGTRIVRR